MLEKKLFGRGGQPIDERCLSGREALAFNATTDRSYTVEYQDPPGPWSTWTNITALTTNVGLANPLISTQRFYRVSTPLK